MIRILSSLVFLIGIFYILFALLQLNFMDIYPQDEYRFGYVLWGFGIGIGCIVLSVLPRLFASSD